MTQPIKTVLDEIAAEQARQVQKWGEQHHPDGTGPDVFWGYAGLASRVVWAARNETQALADDGDVTWLAILLEEVAEAFAESDQAKLRAELIQVAAVVATWIENIDRRTTQAPKVHKPFTDDGLTYCGWYAGPGTPVVDGCGEIWPCATTLARRAAEVQA